MLLGLRSGHVSLAPPDPAWADAFAVDAPPARDGRGDERWRAHRAVRDPLRAAPARAAATAALERALAERHGDDRAASTDGEAAFAVETLRRAGHAPNAT